jgi:transposase
MAENAIPKLKVELTQRDWNVLLQVIDQSNFSHITVESIKKVIVGQLNEQLQPPKVVEPQKEAKDLNY